MTTTTDARRAFKAQIKGDNIMTPTAIAYGWTADGHPWELTQGTDFDRNPLYGVTVAEREGWVDLDRSRLFRSRPDAETYIREELE